MGRSLGSSALLRGTILAGLVGVALFLRTFFVYGQCFPGPYVNFQGTDPWYHVRAVEYLIHQFPYTLGFDPYALHPGGQHVAVGPLFDLAVAAIALVAGFGSPSSSLTYTICAWFPAILGALIPIPIYFLGKRLRDVKAGLIAAALIAILPGPLLRRSLLGYADHHVAECLLSLITAVLFLRAIHRFNRTATAVDPKRCRGPTSVGAGLWSAAGAGIALGAYLLTWVGGSLFVLVIFCALVCHAIADHFSGRSPAAPCRVGIVAFGCALLMVLPYYRIPGFQYHIVSLVGAVVAMLVLQALSQSARLRGWSGRRFIGLLILLIVFGLGGLRVVAPSPFEEVLGSIQRFVAGQAGTFVIEASPILYEKDVFSLAPLWEMFGLTPLWAAVGFALLVSATVRQHSRNAMFLVVWTIFVAAATLAQRRFAYYLAAHIALLAGYLWSWLLDVGFAWNGIRPVRAIHLRRTIGVGLVLGAGLYPLVAPAMRLAAEHTGPPPDWHAAMAWLRDNTPEPFGDPSAYVSRYEPPGALGPYAAPPSAYGVLCWWDHGYWISALARRVPNSNPTQAGAEEVARFWTAQDEHSANLVLDRLGSKFVVAEGTLPVWEDTDSGRLIGKFQGIIQWAGRNPTEFFETYYRPKEDGTFEPMTIYYPAYYRSMLTRLYVFAGRGYIPNQTTWAIQFVEKVDPLGRRVKQIVRSVRFADDVTAERFVARQEDDHWRIAGINHAQSCVPLAPLERYKLVYKSPTTVAQTVTEDISYVEIFEYLGATAKADPVVGP